MPHQTKKIKIQNHGVWYQCKKCGATKHMGFWWSGEFSSDKEPPCTTEDTKEFKEWSLTSVI